MNARLLIGAGVALAAGLVFALRPGSGASSGSRLGGETARASAARAEARPPAAALAEDGAEAGPGKPASTGAAAPSPVAPGTTSARLPKLLDLGANTCVPCKAMRPVLDGLRTDYAGKFEVEFIDLWKDHEAGETWRVVIMPTQVFLAADGRELARHEGFMSREAILAQWRQLAVALD